MSWKTILSVVAVMCVGSVANAEEPAAALADKTAVLKGEYIAPDRTPAIGIDLLLGQMTGIRPTVAIAATERSSVVIEGYYGGLFTKFGDSEGAGVGVRWKTSRGGVDCVTFGPGVDVLFHFNAGKAVMLAPTIDLAWQHSFGNRAGLVLGINAGVGIGLSGYEREYQSDPVSGKVTPLISFYSGLRY